MLQPNGLYWLGFPGAVAVLLCAFYHYHGLKNPLRGSGGLHRAKSLLKKCAQGLQRWHGAAVIALLFLGTGILLALSSFGVLSNRYIPFAFLSGGLCAVLPQLLDLRFMPRWSANGAATMEVSPRKGLTLLTKASRIRSLTAVGAVLAEFTAWTLFLSTRKELTALGMCEVLMTLGLGGTAVTFLSRHLGLFSAAAYEGSSPIADGDRSVPVTDSRNPASAAHALGTCIHQPAASASAAWRCLISAACALGALTYSDIGLDAQTVFFPLLIAWASPLLSLLSALRGMPAGSHWDTRDLPHRFWSGLRLTVLLTAAVGLPFSFLLLGSFRPWLAFVLGLIAAPIAIQIIQLSAKMKPIAKAEQKFPLAAYGVMALLGLLPLLLLAAALWGAYTLCGGVNGGGLYGLAMAGIGFLVPTTDLLTASSFALMARGSISLTWLSGDMTEPVWATDLGILSDQFSAIGRSGSLLHNLAAAGLLLAAWELRRGLTLTPDGLFLGGIALGVLTVAAVVALLLFGMKKSAAALKAESERQAPEIKGLHAGKSAPNPSACVDAAVLSSLVWTVAALAAALAIPLLALLIPNGSGLTGTALAVLIPATVGGIFLITSGEHWRGAVPDALILPLRWVVGPALGELALLIMSLLVLF